MKIILLMFFKGSEDKKIKKKEAKKLELKRAELEL